MPITSDVHWIVNLHKFELQGMKIEVKSKSVLFDTGSTFSFMPKDDFDIFIKEILKADPLCKFINDQFVCPSSPFGASDPKYPKFKIYGGVPGMGAILEFGPK
jgi:hypothetical protein